MKRITFLLVAFATLAFGVAFTAPGSRHAVEGISPIFVKKIPAEYRDWKVVSVAHEAGDLNDIRAILGNDIAIKAYLLQQARQRRAVRCVGAVATFVHDRRLRAFS